MDTIFAPATAQGKAGVAIVRISGPDAFTAGRRIAGALPDIGVGRLRRLRDQHGLTIDTALVICFSAGGSFTGEETVELQCHGSVAVLNALQRELSAIPSLRRAEPGEFTRRALYNDRLDLTQVEGLADLIDAETELQRVQAMSIVTGALSDKVDAWRIDLIDAAALVESSLDFSEEDVPVDVLPDVLAHVDRVRESIKTVLNRFEVSERIRAGFEVAIVGPPNTGKSTLLNAMANRPAALTSEIAGTTRDVIEVRMDIAGLPVTLLDTAGMRETADPLERAGIDLARTRSAHADLRIYLDDELNVDRQEEDDIAISCKADLTGKGVSGLTGQGVEDLISQVGEVLSKRVPVDRIAIRERHRDALHVAILGLDECIGELKFNGDLVLAAEGLRSAISALNQIIGRVDVEDLLGAIFSRFCIGK